MSCDSQQVDRVSSNRLISQLGKGGTQKINTLPKTTRLVSGRSRIQNFQTPKLGHYLLEAISSSQSLLQYISGMYLHIVKFH